MPAHEVLEWMLYESVEPFGDRRGDIQAAQIVQTLANIHRSEKRQPYRLTDFLLEWEAVPVKAQTPDEIFSAMLLLQQAQNALVS